MRRKTASAKRAIRLYTTCSVGCIDLDDESAAFLIEGNEFVTRDLWQGKGQEVSIQIRRTHSTAESTKSPIAGPKGEVRVAVALDRPTPLR